MNVLQTLLDTHDWGDYTAMINDLKAWERWPLFMEAFHALDRSVLYQSPIHGEGHIERTMLFGALTARDERLSAADAGLLFDACAYHDVGRRDDSLDDDHGRRSALRLGEITGRTGDELHMFQITIVLGSYPQGWLEGAFSALAGQVQGALPDGLFASLLVDGVIAGVGGVLSFVPLVLIMPMRIWARSFAVPKPPEAPTP